MLPKAKRLKTRDFKPEKRPKTRLFSDFLSISYGRSETNRFAVVVSWQITKSKPKKNTFRRKVYTILRQNESKMPKNKGFVVIVYPKKEALFLKTSELEKELISLLNKIK